MSKADQAIAHLGRRLGKLDERNRALAQLCNEEAGKRAKTLAENHQLTEVHARQADTIRGLQGEVARLEQVVADYRANTATLSDEKANLETLVVEHVAQAERLVGEVGRLRRERNELADQRARQVNATAAWASAASGDPEYSLAGTPSVGTDVVSQHLVGVWKVLTTPVDDTEAALVRLGRTVGDETALIVWDLGTAPLEQARY
jgi:ABC-type transporter Mla subunit MlaD